MQENNTKLKQMARALRIGDFLLDAIGTCGVVVEKLDRPSAHDGNWLRVLWFDDMKMGSYWPAMIFNGKEIMKKQILYAQDGEIREFLEMEV